MSESEDPTSGPDGPEDEGFDLLTSPLRSVGVARLFVYGGPIGLAIAIVLSLWASWMHVRHTVVVHVEQQWVAFERLAVRAELVSESTKPVTEVRGELWIEQGGQSIRLPEPAAIADTGLIQATFDVPDLAPGPAQLHVTLTTEGADPYHEAVEIEIVAAREAREATPTVSASTLQHGDDSDPQLQPIRIDIRPDGRVSSEFENTFYVRVLHPDGRPYAAEVEVLLVDGSLGDKQGDPDAPVRLSRGPTDALGLAIVRGRLGSEVLRLEARVVDGETVRFKRRMRFVSFAGAVTVSASTRHVQPEAEVEVLAHGLSGKRPVFVDVHAPDGAWVDTFDPPFLGLEEPRLWRHGALPPGILQFEAYNFTHDPGESTALARVQVVSGDPDAMQSVLPLVAAQRAQLHVPRVELDRDRELDRAYLAWLETATLAPAELQRARAWLLGTLPIAVYGSPTALRTRQRDLDAMAARRQWWMTAMRVFLLGGGGLFLAAMMFMMLRSHGRAAASTMAELERLTEGRARVDIKRAVERARREALLRGLGVVTVMAVTLVLATILLEKLVWIY